MTSVTSLTLSSVHLISAALILFSRRLTTVVTGISNTVTDRPAVAAHTPTMRINKPNTTRIYNDQDKGLQTSSVEHCGSDVTECKTDWEWVQPGD